MTLSFTHNAFLTADIDACLDFYQRWCGMRIVKDRGRDDPDQAHVVWLAPKDHDAPIFVIAHHPSMPALTPASEPVLRHFGFDLGTREAVDELYRRFVAAGVAAPEPEDLGDIAGYLFFVRDPDGRVVEFSAGQDVTPAAWDVPRSGSDDARS